MSKCRLINTNYNNCTKYVRQVPVLGYRALFLAASIDSPVLCASCRTCQSGIVRQLLDVRVRYCEPVAGRASPVLCASCWTCQSGIVRQLPDVPVRYCAPAAGRASPQCASYWTCQSGIVRQRWTCQSGIVLQLLDVPVRYCAPAAGPVTIVTGPFFIKFVILTLIITI